MGISLRSFEESTLKGGIERAERNESGCCVCLSCWYGVRVGVGIRVKVHFRVRVAGLGLWLVLGLWLWLGLTNDAFGCVSIRAGIGVRHVQHKYILYYMFLHIDTLKDEKLWRQHGSVR